MVLRSGAEWALPCPRPAGYTRPDLEPLSFDDLPLGGEWTTRRRTISESDIALFSGVAGDFSPLTIEADHGTARAVPPSLLLAMAVGLGSMDMPVPSVIEWEWLNWKFPRPVHAGDTIYARWTLTQKRPPAAGATSSIVVWRVDLHTADGAMCAEGEVGAKVRRQAASLAPRQPAAQAVRASAPASSPAPAGSAATPRRSRRRRRPGGNGAAPAEAPVTAPAPVPVVAKAAERASSAPRRRRRRRPAAAGRESDGGAAPGPTSQPAVARPDPAPKQAEPQKSPLSRVIGRLRRAQP